MPRLVNPLFFFPQSTASDSEVTFRPRQTRPTDRHQPRKTVRKIIDDDDSSGISSSDYGDAISGNVRRSDVKNRSRQPKKAPGRGVKRHSVGDENSEAVQYSLQQINNDLSRILKLLSSRPPAFAYPPVTQPSFATEPVTQPFPDNIRGSRVSSSFPESTLGTQAQSPYTAGPVSEPYPMRSAGVPVLPGRQSHIHNL